MAFRPHKFGRYTIVDPIAVGGMAEIYRARLTAGKDGPDRIIIIKKVISNLSQNVEFVQMFEEEIKVTVGLTHPNIIQIYDYGQVDGLSFLAMEYVEGKNLRQFVSRLNEAKSMFSIDMSCYIISQTCHALGYAHSFKDRLTGKHLGIVHRDISPQNVMISYDGAVKLFDFGIAKAKSANEATQAGVIKGKPSYLSPEQIAGEELDGRCDIFALGIVLWELLTAKRLFVADNDLAILRMIQSAKIEPPSTFNPAIPPALDAIVIKSLARDRTKRYQNAEEFQRDLHKFLYSFNASFNPADLSYYAQELFKKEIKEDRERLLKFLSMDPVEDPNAAAPNEEEKTELKKKAKESTKLADGLVSGADFARDAMEEVMKSQASGTFGNQNTVSLVDVNSKDKSAPGKTSWVNRPPPPPGGVARSGSDVIPPWSKGVSAGSVSTKAGSATTTKLNRRGGSTQALHEEIESQGRSGARNVAIFAAVLLVGLVVFAQQYGYINLPFISSENNSVAENTNATNREPASDKKTASVPVVTSPLPTNTGVTGGPMTPVNVAALILKGNVDGFNVTLNNVPVRMTGNQLSIPVNVKVIIGVSKSGFAPLSFEVAAPDNKPILYTINFKPLPMGELFFNTTPNAKLTFYREDARDPAATAAEPPIVMQTPVVDKPFVAGSYRVRVENQILGYSTDMNIVVEEGKKTRIDKALQ